MWMSQDNRTDPEILYQGIPKYILMRGYKPLSEMGFMSPQFKALTKSQDLIQWRDFTDFPPQRKNTLRLRLRHIVTLSLKRLIESLQLKLSIV